MTNNEIVQAAAAIAQAGSPDYTHHAGATLTLMSEQTRAGELEAMCTTLLAHTDMHPGDHHKLVESLPAKVLNQYIYINRGHSACKVERWREQTPDWSGTLKRAADDPSRFAAIARAMADEIGG